VRGIRTIRGVSPEEEEKGYGGKDLRCFNLFDLGIFFKIRESKPFPVPVSFPGARLAAQGYLAAIFGRLPFCLGDSSYQLVVTVPGLLPFFVTIFCLYFVFIRFVCRRPVIG